MALVCLSCGAVGGHSDGSVCKGSKDIPDPVGIHAHAATTGATR